MTADRLAEIEEEWTVLQNTHGGHTIAWLIAEIRRLQYKNKQYAAMLKIAAPAALAICDADISHDRG